MTDIHSCSPFCERPECVKARAAVSAEASSTPRTDVLEAYWLNTAPKAWVELARQLERELAEEVADKKRILEWARADTSSAIRDNLEQAEKVLKAWAGWNGPMVEDDAFTMQEQAKKYFALKTAPPWENTGQRRFPICKDHQNAEWNQPRLDDADCVLCRLFYLEAQENLLEEWQQRACRAEQTIAEIERPLDAQMARLNEHVVRLNGENEHLKQQIRHLGARQEMSLGEQIRKAKAELAAMPDSERRNIQLEGFDPFDKERAAPQVPAQSHREAPSQEPHPVPADASPPAELPSSEKDRHAVVPHPLGDEVLMPRKLTAENGMKGALIGEFWFKPHEDAGPVYVPWVTIKEIYDRVVSLVCRSVVPSSEKDRKRLIDNAISDLAQLYGLIEEGEYDKASDYCKAAAEWYTQEIASLAALPRSIHPS